MHASAWRTALIWSFVALSDVGNEMVNVRIRFFRNQSIESRLYPSPAESSKVPLGMQSVARPYLRESHPPTVPGGHGGGTSEAFVGLFLSFARLVAMIAAFGNG